MSNGEMSINTLLGMCGCVWVCVGVCGYVCVCVTYCDPHKRSSRLPSASPPNQAKQEHNEHINRKIFLKYIQSANQALPAENHMDS